jgi:hypothetical protein
VMAACSALYSLCYLVISLISLLCHTSLLVCGTHQAREGAAQTGSSFICVSSSFLWPCECPFPVLAHTATSTSILDVFTFPTIDRYGRWTKNGKMMTFGRSLPSCVQKVCFPGGRVAAAIDHLTGSRESTRGVGTNIYRCHHGSYDDVQLKQKDGM